jgi:disulfide bond formation protein DsbB
VIAPEPPELSAPAAAKLRALSFGALVACAHSWLQRWRGGLLFVLVSSVSALGFALLTQYAFGYEPCVLCLWQRVPYALAALLAGVALWQEQSFRLWQGACLLLCALLLLSGVGLAIFHHGVEQHWWAGTAGCAIQTGVAPDAASLRQVLLTQPVARCDQITWTFLGWSMTVWNGIYALVCSVIAAYSAVFGKPEVAQPVVWGKSNGAS